MRLLLRTPRGLFIALAVGAGAGTVCFLALYPRVGPLPAILIHVTAAVLQRGGYLANHVAVCMGCNSTRDWDLLSGPIVPGTEGSSGERLGREFGFTGTLYAANITLASLSQWTDGEILRAITRGVTRTGRAMFPAPARAEPPRSRPRQAAGLVWGCSAPRGPYRRAHWG